MQIPCPKVKKLVQKNPVIPSGENSPQRIPGKAVFSSENRENCGISLLKGKICDIKIDTIL